jgi:hypothetical protein
MFLHSPLAFVGPPFGALGGMIDDLSELYDQLRSQAFALPSNQIR